MLFQLPRDCRVFTKLAPANQWSWNEILANKTNYLLETLIWQKSKDAQKKIPRHRPRPFVPEFIKKSLPASPINNGAEVRDVDDVRSILSLPRG